MPSCSRVRFTVGGDIIPRFHLAMNSTLDSHQHNGYCIYVSNRFSSNRVPFSRDRAHFHSAIRHTQNGNCNVKRADKKLAVSSIVFFRWRTTVRPMSDDSRGTTSCGYSSPPNVDTKDLAIGSVSRLPSLLCIGVYQDPYVPQVIRIHSS